MGAYAAKILSDARLFKDAHRRALLCDGPRALAASCSCSAQKTYADCQIACAKKAGRSRAQKKRDYFGIMNGAEGLYARAHERGHRLLSQLDEDND